MIRNWLGSSGGFFTPVSGAWAWMTQGLGSAGATDQRLHMIQLPACMKDSRASYQDTE